MNNVKNTWKGIKSVITILNLSSDIPKSISSNVSIFINKLETSNVINKYFGTIAEKKQKKISITHLNISLSS